MKNGLSVVISSVYEREQGFKDYRFVAKSAAEGLGFEAIRNPEDSGMQQRAFEECIVDDNPVFILIIGAEDSTAVRRECKLALDNCLPLLVFIKTQDNTILDTTKKIISEISKMTYEKDCCCFSTCEELYNAVRERLLKYLRNKVSAFPSLDAYIGPAYNYSIGMFEHAKKRAVLYQKTSSLILGPKIGNATEQAFNANMFRWLENMTDNMEFLHIYSGPQTKKALNDSIYDTKLAKTKLSNIITRPNIINNKNIMIRELSHNVDTAFFMCDCETMFILTLDKEKYTITIPPYIMRNSELAKIVTQLNSTGRRKSLEDLLRLYENT